MNHPNELQNWPTCSITRTGGRQNNQDFCDFDLKPGGAGCWVVADGLGAHAGGEEASKRVVTTLLAAYAEQPGFTKDALADYLSKTQNAVRAQQRLKPQYADMRSTVVLLLRQNDRVLWAHVGDSRLYHFRDGEIIFQTKDHSVPQMLVAAGEIDPEQIREHSDRNRLLRSVGELGDIAATYLKEPASTQPGDAFLLCTDGFWEYVLEAEMETDLNAANDPESWLAAMERRILKKASGDYDNYSAMGIWVE